MQRVVVLGRGGAGKSTAAAELVHVTGLPVIELDKHFWGTDLSPLPRPEWTRRQQELAAAPRWVRMAIWGPTTLPRPGSRGPTPS